MSRHLFVIGLLVSSISPSSFCEAATPTIRLLDHELKTETEQATVQPAPAEAGSDALDLVFTRGREYPAVRLLPPAPLNLAAYIGIEAKVTNLDTTERKIVLRVDNDGDWQREPWNSEVEVLSPGETKVITVFFGQSYGTPGYKLDPAAVTAVLISTPQPEQSARLRLLRLSPVSRAATAPIVMAQSAAAPPEPYDYVQVWGDEFEKNGRPDPAKWGYELGPKLRNNELSHYTDRIENARVQNGNLVIEARREDYQGSRYTSASLTTRETLTFVYGRLEVRAKIPGGRGVWPALWMLGWHNEKAWWPEVGEIDLMEHVGFEPDQLFFTLHTLARNHSKKNELQAFRRVPDLLADYHLYRLDWTRDEVVLFFDNQEVLRQRKTGESMAEWPFANPMYAIMNITVGGDWGGMKGIDDKAFPARMLVDYVRLYKAVPRTPQSAR